MTVEFTQTEQNLINTAKSVLQERGYTVTVIVRDSFGCPNVMIKNPNGEQYPDLNGCIVFPSGRTNADKFEFRVS